MCQKLNQLLLITLVLFVSIAFYSCSKDDTDSEKTVFNLRMTDDPIENLQQVNVDIQTVIVITEEGRDSFEMNTNSGIYNLLDYQGDLDTLLGSIILNTNVIQQIRLVLGEENSVMVDSLLYDLKTPSAQQSGLKINVQADLSDLEIYDLLIDFDAQKSIIQQGNGDFSLKPVIRIVE